MRRFTFSATTCPLTMSLSTTHIPAVHAWTARKQGRAALHPDLRVPAKPDRSPVRAPADVHDGHLDLIRLRRSGRDLHQHLRWRNASIRHPTGLAAQRSERTRIGGEGLTQGPPWRTHAQTASVACSGVTHGHRARCSCLRSVYVGCPTSLESDPTNGVRLLRPGHGAHPAVHHAPNPSCTRTSKADLVDLL